MRAEDIRSFLVQRGVTFDERELQDAVQFRCYDGEVFNVYHTGTVVVGGRPSSLAEEVRKWSGASATVKGAHEPMTVARCRPLGPGPIGPSSSFTATTRRRGMRSS